MTNLYTCFSDAIETMDRNSPLLHDTEKFEIEFHQKNYVGAIKAYSSPVIVYGAL